MRKIGVICGITASLAIVFFSPPVTAFSIRVGSFYIHVPLVRHHHHTAHLHSSSRYRTAIGEPEQTERQPTSIENCSGLVPGLTNLPIAQIRRTVHPTAEQDAAFGDLSTAISQASDAIKSSCPSTVPLTPLSRLDAAEQRFDAVIKAVQIVRTPLAKVYDALSDEQKRQFNAIDGATPRARSGTKVANTCSQQAGSFIDLPLQRIEKALEPTLQQQAALDDLRNATQRAAAQLQSSCPTGLPHSPVARLDMIEARLKAVADAMKTVRPPLENFYAALNDEQKARFNIVGPKAE
jgi:LTXXQ motif family protein